MKIFVLILFLSMVSSSSFGKMQNIDEIIRKANQRDKTNLMKLISDISLEPIKDPATGKIIFKVTEVATGSIYQKAGIKVGDLVTRDDSGEIR